MSGMSYLGLVQWSAVFAQRPNLKAIVPTFCSTDLHSIVFDGGAASTGLIFRWTWIIFMLADKRPLWEWLKFFWQGDEVPAMVKASRHRPYKEVDKVICNRTVEWLQEGLDHPCKHDGWWVGEW